MNTLAEFDAANAAKRVKLERELTLAAKAAVLPLRVQENSSGMAAWLTYQAETLADALAIMAAAPIVPAYQYKATFSRIQPEALANDKSGDQVAGPFAVSLKTNQGDGYGPTATLSFFVMAGDELCNARVDIGATGRPSAHWQWGATWIKNPQGRKVRRGDSRNERGDYRANGTLSAMSDHTLTWGTGGDGSASYEYFWMADQVDGGSEHAVEQLSTIANGNA